MFDKPIRNKKFFRLGIVESNLSKILRRFSLHSVKESRSLISENNWNVKKTLKCENLVDAAEIVTPHYSTLHCSYLYIYISKKIRLCKSDFEGKFQFNLQAKSITFLDWKFRFTILIFHLFLQNLSNPLLFTHCCCYSKELQCAE